MCNEKRRTYNESVYRKKETGKVYEASYEWNVMRVCFVKLNGEVAENGRHIVGTKLDRDIYIPEEVIDEMKVLADKAITFDVIKDSKSCI